MKKLITVLCFLGCVNLANAGIDDANKAQEQGNYQEALKEYQILAEQGDATAQANLGLMFYQGQGVNQDYKQAAEWMEKSAIQGKAGAQYNLGVMYHEGQGVYQDPKQAAVWFQKAAEQGDVIAQIKMGFLYANGDGLPQSLKQAANWYRKAAVQGNVDAQFQMGQTYYFGQGVPQNYKEAFDWYQKAAAQGNADAQLNLGVMYAKGEGVPYDARQALAWVSKAAEQGNLKAKDIMNETTTSIKLNKGEIGVGNLIQSFKENKIAAEERYSKGSQVVRGCIQEVSRDRRGQLFVGLKNECEDDEVDIAKYFHVFGISKEELLKLKYGNSIGVKCKSISQDRFYIEGQNCQLVK